MRLTGYYILLFLFSGSFGTVDAQDYFNLDSLWNEFNKSRPDTNRVLLYIQLGQQYENNKPDSAILLYEAALKLSENLNYVPGIIKYYTNVTYVYNLLGRYDTSLVLNLRSVEIARAYGNSERLAACLGNVGASYVSMGDYERAIEFTLEASKIYEELNDKQRLTVLYGNLTAGYQEMGRYEKALEYGERSLSVAREIKNVFAITSALVNLSNVYKSLGQLNKSILALEEARVVARKTNNDYVLLLTSLTLIDVHHQLADFGSMKKYCDEALALARKLDDRESIVIALRGLALFYFYTGNTTEAEEYALNSLEKALAYKLTGHVGKAYSVLAEISIVKHDFKKNIFYSLKSDSIHNLLLNESIAKNIQNLEVKYEASQKEQQIKRLEQEAKIKDLSIERNRLMIFTLCGTIALILVIVFLIRWSFKQKREILQKENALNQSRIGQLEQEQQLMASEAVIKGQEEERGRLAKDLHDGLGGLLSGVKFSLTNMKSNVILDSESALVFERSLDMLDHSISELRRVAHNMMPEVLVKFGLTEAVKSYCDSIRQAGIFQIDFQPIGTDPRLPSGSEIILYRIIQELLNNSVKHSKASMVLVQLAWQADEVSITVEDNGVGFDVQALEKSNGSGWPNIKSRVNYLNGKIDIQSSKGHGTSVHLLIKI